VDVGEGEPVRFTAASGGSCEVDLRAARPVNDFASVGKVVCR